MFPLHLFAVPREIAENLENAFNASRFTWAILSAGEMDARRRQKRSKRRLQQHFVKGGSGVSTGLAPMAGKGKIENLRPPWKPGQSGNPSGRPKRRPISDAYAEFLQRPVPDKLRRELDLWEGATSADAIAARQVSEACKGSVAATREIREATEGKVGERPKEVAEEIRIRVVYEDTPSQNSDALTSETETRNKP